MLVGIIILAIGVLYLLEVLIPVFVVDYSIIWPSILIVAGIYFMIKQKKIDFGNVLVLFVGVWWLLINLSVIAAAYTKIFWPILLIIIGLSIVTSTITFTKSIRKGRKGQKDKSGLLYFHGVFGGIDEKVKEKDFKGAVVYSVFGGCDLNLEAIELAEDNVDIMVYSIFGGSTIVMPKGYNIKFNSTAIFGANENKSESEFKKGQKTINISCISVFGGAELK